MPLFLVEWKLATEVAVFSGKAVVVGDDDAHAIERCKSSLGKEGAAASYSVSRVGTTVYEISRKERLADCDSNRPLPEGGVGGELFAFEVAARANVVASSEKVAFTRFANAIKAGQSDGKYCKLLKFAVLDREQFTSMSNRERHSLSVKFNKVSGGRVSPR